MSPKKTPVERDLQQACNDTYEQRDLINNLNHDTLSEIFMWLPIPERLIMEEVCSKWQKACELAWNDIKKYKCESSIGRSYDNRLLTQSYVETILLKCGIYLKELSLSSVVDVSIMPIVVKHCKNLTNLECEFTEYSIHMDTRHFIEAFTQLDKLRIIKICIQTNRIDSSDRIISLFDIFNSLPEEIEEIYLRTKKLTNLKNYILFNLKKFTNLQKLKIDGMWANNCVRQLVEKTKLVYLDIHIDQLPENFFPFNQLVNLEHISVSSGYCGITKNFTTDIFDSILRTCKKLKYLDLPRGVYDVDEIPQESWANCKYLEHLGIKFHAISVDLQTTIVKYCKNLKYLCLENMNHLFHEMFSKKLTELKNLECLKLVGYQSVNDEVISAISNNFKKLRHLKITSCNTEPSINVQRLSSRSGLEELSKLQYLEHLDFDNLRKLRDSTIIAIANNCKYLKCLKIFSCTNITEVGFIALTKLENLQELNVNSPHITDNVIIKLRGIKKLDCAGCQNLTDAGIIEFIHNNPDLEHLDISYIKNITVKTVIYADRATENRVNGVILYIHIHHKDIKKSFRWIIKSQWLVLEPILVYNNRYYT